MFRVKRKKTKGSQLSGIRNSIARVRRRVSSFNSLRRRSSIANRELASKYSGAPNSKKEEIAQKVEKIFRDHEIVRDSGAIYIKKDNNHSYKVHIYSSTPYITCNGKKVSYQEAFLGVVMPLEKLINSLRYNKAISLKFIKFNRSNEIMESMMFISDKTPRSVNPYLKMLDIQNITNLIKYLQHFRDNILKINVVKIIDMCFKNRLNKGFDMSKVSEIRLIQSALTQLRNMCNPYTLGLISGCSWIKPIIEGLIKDCEKIISYAYDHEMSDAVKNRTAWFGMGEVVGTVQATIGFIEAQGNNKIKELKRDINKTDPKIFEKRLFLLVNRLRNLLSAVFRN